MVLKQRGISLIEILVVIAIIFVLAALTFPVLSSSMKSSKESRVKSNMRQVYLGLMLYRESNNPKVEYGEISEMGLPRFIFGKKTALAVVNDENVWRSPCRCHPDANCSNEENFIDYWDYMYLEESWNSYVKEFEGNAVLLFDPHCTDHGNKIHDSFSQKERRLTGVRLNGQIITRVRNFPALDKEKFWLP